MPAPENHIVCKIWQICSAYGRDGMNGALKAEAVLDCVRAYDETHETFELVLFLEAVMRPLMKELKKKKEKEEEDGRSPDGDNTPFC